MGELSAADRLRVYAAGGISWVVEPDDARDLANAIDQANENNRKALERLNRAAKLRREAGWLILVQCLIAALVVAVDVISWWLS